MALVIAAVVMQPVGALAQISPLDGAPQTDGASPETADLADPETRARVDQYIDGYLSASVDGALAKMTVEDRVGQLFIVNFQGDETDFDSDVVTLLNEYRIGGVILSPAYGNFSNQKNQNTPKQVASLANRLQALAHGLLLPPDVAIDAGANFPLDQLPLFVSPDDDLGRQPLGIPLFIGIEQFGDDMTLTSLRNGFTQLPNQLTLGSTWDPALTRGVGEVVGRELAAVGINLLLGPSLDVLAQPRADAVGGLGVHMFGGDPFWAGEMGRAYIAGVHEGSRNRIATVARHFPGQGDVDRIPGMEVATIQNTADTLRRVALPPFTAVTHATGDESDEMRPTSVTDALMSSHMRYSAFQAVGKENQSPLGFSPELRSVLAREGFGDWRTQGGLLMSNALGLPAIRSEYSESLAEFPFRRAALDAFTAGNDLIYLGSLSEDGVWESELDNIVEIVGFFQDRYVSDLDFAAQVDEAVRRILRFKLLLYLDMETLIDLAVTELAAPENGPTDADAPTVELPDDASFVPLAQLLVGAEDLAILNSAADSRLQANALVRAVAGDSITILYPDPLAVTDALPAAPKLGESLLIFTDSRLFQECDTCLAEAPVPPEEIEEIIVRLYGPDATGQITAEQLTSLTFSDLAEVLEMDAEQTNPATPPPAADVELTTTAPISTPTRLVLQLPGEDKASKIERQIDEADWIIFAMLNVDPVRYPNSDVVKRFLRERSGQLVGKNVIVLALQSPYFLDATEIGQLTSYLGVYSKSTPFLENAVRTLFRNFVPGGAPAVNVPGTRFSDLRGRLAPDADAELPLAILLGDVNIIDNVATPTVSAGETIRIQVGPILDYNGHRVPNGVKVDFQLNYEGTELALPTAVAFTQDGIATRTVLLDYGGILRVSASSGEATTGAPISVAVIEGSVSAEFESAAATLSPSEAGDAALQQAAPGNGAGSGSTENGEGAPSADASPLLAPGERVNLVTLIVALFTMLVVLSLLLIVQVGTLPRTTLVYNMLWAVIVGLIAYIIYGVGWLPGSQWLRAQLSVGGAAVVVILGMILPLLWLQLKGNSATS